MNKLTAREEAIRQKVRQARKLAKMSQTEVAEVLGLSQAGYAHYDRGRQPFAVDHLFKLAALFNRPIEWLLGLPSDLTEDEQQLLAAYRQIETPLFRELALDQVRAQTIADARIRGERGTK